MNGRNNSFGMYSLIVIFVVLSEFVGHIRFAATGFILDDGHKFKYIEISLPFDVRYSFCQVKYQMLIFFWNFFKEKSGQ